MDSQYTDWIAELARHCSRTTHWMKTAAGPRHVKEPLKVSHLERHLNGTYGVGLAPIAPGERTTRIALLDFDSHKGESTWGEMVKKALEVVASLRQVGLVPMLFRSSGGRGIHLVLLWQEPQDAFSVRQHLLSILKQCSLENGTGGVKAAQVEVFPKQDSVPEKGYGSMFILPLTGESAPLNDKGEVEDIEYACSRALKYSAPVPIAERTQIEHTSAQVAAPAQDLTELKSALDSIPNGVSDSLDYDSWRDVIFGIHDASSGSDEGYALAIEFSARSPKFDLEFFDNRVWPYIRSDGREKRITAATVYARAREHGWRENVEFEDLTAGGPVSTTKKGERFKLLSASEMLARPPSGYVLKGLIPANAIVALYGEPGTGKSFLALEWAVHVARNEPWGEHRCNGGKVVYVAAEGEGGFGMRVEAIARHRGLEVESLEVFILPAAPNLLEKADVHLLAERMRALGEVRMIVIDTLARTTPGANENSSEDMGLALANADFLRRTVGATVMLVHHSGKDATKGLRGWSGFNAAADAVLEVTRSESLRQIKITKAKDGVDGRAYDFRLIPISLGLDLDADERNSCVIEWLEKGAVKRSPRGTNARVVWEAAHSTIGLVGESAPVETVITEAVRGLSHDPKAGRDRRRELAKRALSELVRDRFLTCVDNEIRVLGLA